MGFEMKILSWFLIVYISSSSVSLTTAICSKDVCQVLSQLDLQEEKLHELDDKSNKLLKQNTEVSPVLYAHLNTLHGKQLLLMERFEALESKLLKKADSDFNYLKAQREEEFINLSATIIDAITDKLSEQIRNATQISTNIFKPALIGDEGSSRKVPQMNTTTPILLAVPTTLTSTLKSPLPSDCMDLYDAGHKSSGVLIIYPQGRETAAFCDMTTDGGGWTVILNRRNQRIRQDFYKKWEDYKVGFGDLTEEFWMGNEPLHLMTTSKDYIMRFEAFSDSNEPNSIWGEFHFRVASEQDKYKLTIRRYDTNGTMESAALLYNNNQAFTTHDRDNDKRGSSNCARYIREFRNTRGGDMYAGAFWHRSCSYIYPMAEDGEIRIKYWSKTSKTMGLPTELKMMLRPIN